MRTIAIMNNKGGVGKTVTAINLADILVRDYKKRVLLADCDGQCNLTDFFFPALDEGLSVAEVLTGTCEPLWSDNIMPIRDGLDLLPGSEDLYTLDLQALLYGSDYGARYRMRDFINAVQTDGEVDYLIFDCAPGYTCATVAALMSSDDVVIPVTVDGFSFRGLETMARQISGLRRNGLPAKVAGVLITQWRNTDVVAQADALLRQGEIPVFMTPIRRTDKVPESTFERVPLEAYSPRSAAGRDSRMWVEEYLGGELHGV